jgi:hypothetical protein
MIFLFEHLVYVVMLCLACYKRNKKKASYKKDARRL